VADLYDLKADQLMRLEGFAHKSAAQLVDAIAASQERPLSTFLFALGIRHVGAGVARTLAREFGSLEKLRSATIQQVSDVPGIGAIIAEAVVHFFAEERNRALLEAFERHGFRPVEPAGAQGPLSGQTFVITGTLPTLSRSEAARRL
jgi:DNA ligase (NAD+)